MESGCRNSPAGISAPLINWTHYRFLCWLKGKVFSLHSLQKQFVQFWMSKNYLSDKVVQFLCIFLWQHWQRTVNEFRNVFLLHIEQILMRPIMSGNILVSLEKIYWGRYCALVATFWSHKSTCWGLLLSIFSVGQWLESCAMHLDLGDEKFWLQSMS